MKRGCDMGDEKTRFYEVSSSKEQENLKGHVRISAHRLPGFRTNVRISGRSRKEDR